MFRVQEMVTTNALRWIQEMAMVTGQTELTGKVADWGWGIVGQYLC